MERKALIEHIEQGLSEKTVQSNVEEAEKPKKRSDRSSKVGIRRWTQQLVLQCLEKLEVLETEVRWNRRMLERLGEARFAIGDVEHFAAMDTVDKEILQRLLEVGVDGALPKDLAAEVNRRGGYSLKYYDVARRLVRLNKKLQYETGKLLFEKRGKRWALTRFAFDIYNAGVSEESPASTELLEEEL